MEIVTLVQHFENKWAAFELHFFVTLVGTNRDSCTLCWHDHESQLGNRSDPIWCSCCTVHVELPTVGWSSMWHYKTEMCGKMLQTVTRIRFGNRAEGWSNSWNRAELQKAKLIWFITRIYAENVNVSFLDQVFMKVLLYFQTLFPWVRGALAIWGLFTFKYRSNVGL